jgi:hypothetical protein
MSVGRSRSGGSRTGIDHVQPVVQVLAERAARDLGLELAVGRRHHPHVDVLLEGPPTGLTFFSCSTRRSLTWSARDSSPISSRNSVPPSASRTRPGFGLDRAGERALGVAEQLALEQVVGDRAAVDRDERPGGAAALVQRPRHQLLAGAGLAADQHGLLGRRHPRDRRAHAAHRRAVADQRGDLAVAGLDRLLAHHHQRVADRHDVAVGQHLVDHARAVDPGAVAALLVDDAHRAGRAGVERRVVPRRLLVAREHQAAGHLAPGQGRAAQRTEAARRHHHGATGVDQVRHRAAHRGRRERLGLVLGGGHAPR